MKTIWKYPLAVTDRQRVRTKRGARVLCAQPQGETLCLWAMVESDADDDDIVVHVARTGHPLPDDIAEFRYLGTVQFSGGSLVFHVFVAPVGVRP